jgi:hypothetical protein
MYVANSDQVWFLTVKKGATLTYLGSHPLSRGKYSCQSSEKNRASLIIFLIIPQIENSQALSFSQYEGLDTLHLTGYSRKAEFPQT